VAGPATQREWDPLMIEFVSTARPKIAGAVALGAVLLVSGCNTTPREHYLTQRSIVHDSNEGRGERLPANPVLAQSKGLDIIRR
jgi:hypothetical protein